jgi:RNA polymerase sigma-70 factor (sigma-E family)
MQTVCGSGLVDSGGAHVLMTTSDDEFARFAAVAFPRLRRTSFLLCGDWHTAEDLAQITLTKVFASWRRILRSDAVDAYARKTLLNAYLADSKRKRHTEVLAGALPERPADLPGPELRLAVMEALATLPPKARAVVILRYWEDQSVEQTAAVLGCSAGTVKSQSARALAKLRSLLAEPEPGADGSDITRGRNGRHDTARSA